MHVFYYFPFATIVLLVEAPDEEESANLKDLKAPPPLVLSDYQEVIKRILNIIG